MNQYENQSREKHIEIARAFHAFKAALETIQQHYPKRTKVSEGANYLSRIHVDRVRQHMDDLWHMQFPESLPPEISPYYSRGI